MPASDEDQFWENEDDNSEDHLPAPTGGELQVKADQPHRQLELVRKAWRPAPIRKPEVDRDLPDMPWPERCAEAIRYAFLVVEHWLSEQGVLREWIRLNLWVGIGLLAAALLVVPPITLLLEGVAEWSDLVETTTLNVTSTVMGLPPIVIAISTLLIVIKLLSRSWQRRREDPCCQGAEAHADPRVSQADSPRLESESETMTFFDNNRKELETQVEYENEVGDGQS